MTKQTTALIDSVLEESVYPRARELGFKVLSRRHLVRNVGPDIVHQVRYQVLSHRPRGFPGYSSLHADACVGSRIVDKLLASVDPEHHIRTRYPGQVCTSAGRLKDGRFDSKRVWDETDCPDLRTEALEDLNFRIEPFLRLLESLAAIETRWESIASQTFVSEDVRWGVLWVWGRYQDAFGELDRQITYNLDRWSRLGRTGYLMQSERLQTVRGRLVSRGIT